MHRNMVCLFDMQNILICGLSLTIAVVTCEIKLFQNYFSFRRRPSEIVLFQRVKTCLKFIENFLRGLLRLMNI